jgi:hypothetical protein
MHDAQVSLDRFCATIGDARPRGETTVGALGDAEGLLALPATPYPAVVQVLRPVADNATVAFRGNRYSVPAGLLGVELVLRHRLGSEVVEIVSPAGALLVAHRLAPPGAGAVVRTPEHHAELEKVVLSAFSTAPPCDRKGNHPPGPEALAEAARLLGESGRDVVVDLADYERLARGAS